LLGLDLGEKRIGVAVSDPLGITARALGRIERKSDAETIREIEAAARENEAEKKIMGLPVNMNGTEGPKAAEARRFAGALTEKTGLKVEFCDERMTTMQAGRFMLEADASRRKRKKKIDSLSAQIILQSYLDRKETCTE